MLYLHGNIKYSIRGKDLELRGEVQVKDINLEIVIVLKAMKLNNFNKGLNFSENGKCSTDHNWKHPNFISAKKKWRNQQQSWIRHGQ